MTKTDSAYAVIRVGGQQYKVSAGDTIIVDRVAAEAGDSLTYPTLAMRTAEGEFKGGEGTVSATVAEHILGDKIKVFTYKPKSTFKKTKGHRSRLTRLTIDSIGLDDEKKGAGDGA